jgi:hypothetical protein
VDSGSSLSLVNNKVVKENGLVLKRGETKCYRPTEKSNRKNTRDPAQGNSGMPHWKGKNEYA